MQKLKKLDSYIYFLTHNVGTLFFNPKKMTNNDPDPIEEDVQEIMDNQGLDADQAERVRDVMEEYGLDEDEAVEVEEAT